jgi:hypothetical protein
LCQVTLESIAYRTEGLLTNKYLLFKTTRGKATRKESGVVRQRSLWRSTDFFPGLNCKSVVVMAALVCVQRERFVIRTSHPACCFMLIEPRLFCKRLVLVIFRSGVHSKVKPVHAKSRRREPGGAGGSPGRHLLDHAGGLLTHARACV